MTGRHVSVEALIEVFKITNGLLDEVIKKAKASPRLRTNYNFHKSYSEPLQRLLNAAEPGTYIRPHKHEDPDKIEVFVILKGRVVIVEFDDSGCVVDHLILDPLEGARAVEIPPGVWHTFIALKSGSVLYEVKEGPYDKISDKNFAKWAPDEGTEAAQEFNRKILKELKIDSGG